MKGKIIEEELKKIKLRIGVLTDSPRLTSWAFEALYAIIKDGYGEIVLNIENQTPKPSGKKSPIIYRLYRAIDRRVFRSGPDAFVLKNCSDLPGWSRIPVLKVFPIQKTYSDQFPQESIEKIRDYDLDIIIRFGFRILKGDILTVPKFGIWSYHHGDNRLYRGGPPCFWEVMKGEKNTGSVLQILSEKLDDGQIIYKSWSQTAPLSAQRNANKVFWKSSYFIARSIIRLVLLGEDQWRKELGTFQNNESDSPVPLYRPPRNLEMFSLWIKLWTKTLVRKWEESRKIPHWDIFIQKSNSQHEGKVNSEIIKLDSPYATRYFADPFIEEHDGKTWLFFEDFDNQEQKACISVGEWDGKGLSGITKVLKEEWHLSYPFIFWENNEVYMIPESGEEKKLYVYRATDFPLRWQKMDLFFDGEAYDPTVFAFQDKYWLFVNQKAHEACSPFDELHLYYSNSFENPDWIPHPMNPVVSDVRCSRPAGKIFIKGNKIIRPAQDSGKFYGHRVKLQEILVLSDSDYKEQTLEIIEPDFFPNIEGTHTYNFSDNWLVLDGYSRKKSN